MTPAITPVYKDGLVKFLVSNGTSRKLVFNHPELTALRSLIDQSLEAYRGEST